MTKRSKAYFRDVLATPPFHLYCERSGRAKHYYRVLIFRDKHLMRLFLNSQYHEVYGTVRRGYLVVS